MTEAEKKLATELINELESLENMQGLSEFITCKCLVFLPDICFIIITNAIS